MVDRARYAVVDRVRMAVPTEVSRVGDIHEQELGELLRDQFLCQFVLRRKGFVVVFYVFWVASLCVFQCFGGGRG